MSDHLEPGDYVLHPRLEGVRGQVLWIDEPQAWVCWETGYEDYTQHILSALKKVNLLDLLVEGRQLKFDHSEPASRCKCGSKLNRSKKKHRGERLTICTKCRVYYRHGSPHVHDHH